MNSYENTPWTYTLELRFHEMLKHKRAHSTAAGREVIDQQLAQSGRCLGQKRRHLKKRPLVSQSEATPAELREIFA